MNRRQKKKAYKKKYGHNPPKTEAKYYGKEWGRIIARTMETVAEGIRAAIPVICDTLEKFARATRETAERIKTMPEDEFLRFLDNPELTEGAKAMARQIRRNGQYGLHTSNAGNIGESGKEGNAAPGTADNTGLHGSRTDNTAGHEYSN